MTAPPDTTRPGQDAFNALARWRPDLAASIAGSAADPFYDDGRLGRFHHRVATLLAAEGAPPADPAPPNGAGTVG